MNRPNIKIEVTNRRKQCNKSMSSFPPLSGGLYQSAVVLRMRFQNAKEGIFNLSLLGKEEEGKFLKKKIDVSSVEALEEDDKMITRMITKMCKEVKTASGVRLKKIENNYSRNSPKTPISTETFITLMNFQNSKLIRIFEDMTQNMKDFEFFVRRLMTFCSQSFIVTTDYNYTLKRMYQCIGYLEDGIRELESFLIKRKEGCAISKVYGRAGSKNKSRKKSKKGHFFNTVFPSEEEEMMTKKPSSLPSVQTRKFKLNFKPTKKKLCSRQKSTGGRKKNRTTRRKKMELLKNSSDYQMLRNKPIFARPPSSFNTTFRRRRRLSIDSERLKDIIQARRCCVTPNDSPLKQKRRISICNTDVNNNNMSKKKENSCSLKTMFRKSEEIKRGDKLVYSPTSTKEVMKPFSLPNLSQPSSRTSTPKKKKNKNKKKKKKYRSKSLGEVKYHNNNNRRTRSRTRRISIGNLSRTYENDIPSVSQNSRLVLNVNIPHAKKNSLVSPWLN